MSGGGHKRVMEIRPSKYEWKRFADHFVREFNLHFRVSKTPETFFITMAVQLNS